MWQYNIPSRDMRFVIEHVICAPQSWREIPSFDQLDIETTEEILAAAGQFASKQLLPLNSIGDERGCLLNDGNVTTPPGFREAYRAFVAAGWPTLACATGCGGQGLPILLQAAIAEAFSACNHAWAMYHGISHGAYECLKNNASAFLCQHYLEKIVSGEYLAAMAITEPNAGSDVSLIRAQAEMNDDGSAQVSGSKIFISGGDHDLTDNIIHLVLCRLPNAPAGNKGLSLVLVPKLLPDGTRNSFSCIGIEKKMGIHGNATCAMQYENAKGWLVGQPHRGLSAMFVMMNSARLHVGLQGLAHLEIATQNALRYAQERSQMRAPVRPTQSAGQLADPIAAHPAIRKKLATAKAYAEGARVICYWTAVLIDESSHHPDASKRKQAEDVAALLTPIVKAFITSIGHQHCNELLQVWGGAGFLRDFGIEQTVRDSRITLIYEGTNEIQAIDLLIRKVLDDQGSRFEQLLRSLETSMQFDSNNELEQAGQHAVAKHIAAIRNACQSLITARLHHPEAPYQVADDFMQAAGHLLMTWAWTRSMLAVRMSGMTDSWLLQKMDLARFGLEWLTPKFDSYLQSVLTPKSKLPSFTIAATIDNSGY